jgi:hypothetical protein
MSILLANKNSRLPLVRILSKAKWDGGGGQWQPLPMVGPGLRQHGAELLSCSRSCLPGIGEARFRFRYGFLNGQLVGASSGSAGQPWDQSSSLSAPDLRGHEIRIQIAPWSLDQSAPAWRTAWWGQVEHQQDQEWPGASYPAGDRIYRCSDGLFRAKRWPLNRHQAYVDSEIYGPVYGHPGYNVGSDGATLGNRESSGVNELSGGDWPSDSDGRIFAHTHQGNSLATTWTDLQACEHALRVSRKYGDPLFSFDGLTSLLSIGVSAWSVREQDSAWDFIVRVCDRKRGRGVAFLSWDDDEDDPTGPLVPHITIMPQTYGDVTYLNSYSASSGTYASTSIDGAASHGSSVDVDLIGDHRLVADTFLITEPEVHTADAVETISERIQVAMPLNYADTESLSEGWLATQETAFAGLSFDARTPDKWDGMFCMHRLKDAWIGKCGDGTTNTSSVVFSDWHMAEDADGTQSLRTSETGKPLTSPIMCRILGDLPFLTGYSYTSSVPTPITSDAMDQARRRPAMALVRSGSDEYVMLNDSENLDSTFALKISGRTIYSESNADKMAGVRSISDNTIDGLGCGPYQSSQLVFVCSVELPHRVRWVSYRVGANKETARRRIVIEHANHHLWLAHPRCVCDLSDAYGTYGFAPVRVLSPTYGPYICRDDRIQLAALHALACTWYLEQRRTVRWELRDCGLIDSFEVITDAESGSTSVVAYPQLGQVVNELAAGGQTRTIRTPITSISYDHDTGTTRWETDWQELEF